MKLTAQVKLVVTPEQADALRETLARANDACNAISEWAWEHKTFGQFAIHKGIYHQIRERFDLAAQMVVRCIAKVADAYKLDKRTIRTFQPTGAIAYDDRILRWQVTKGRVFLWTVKGRLTLPFVCGEQQRALLQTQQGETDLCCLDGSVWFLNATCTVEEPPPADTGGGFLGIDLGIVHLATDSEGRQYSGEAVRSLRRRLHRLRRLRAGLQTCGSKSAKRHLCRLRRRQSRFTRWVNHNISRRLVEAALSSRKALVLEDLKGIRERANGFGREMRFELGSWAFDQLRQFVAYKAGQAGIPVIYIDPRNTSRTCCVCGYCDKANRKTQDWFSCLSCGFAMNADRNAAVNISKHGALVTRPRDGEQPMAA